MAGLGCDITGKVPTPPPLCPAAAATAIASVMGHCGTAAALAHLDTTHKITAVLGNWCGVGWGEAV